MPKVVVFLSHLYCVYGRKAHCASVIILHLGLVRSCKVTHRRCRHFSLVCVCASKLNFLFFPVLCNRRSSIMYEFFIINSKLNLKCTKMVFVRFVKFFIFITNGEIPKLILHLTEQLRILISRLRLKAARTQFTTASGWCCTVCLLKRISNKRVASKIHE